MSVYHSYIGIPVKKYLESWQKFLLPESILERVISCCQANWPDDSGATFFKSKSFAMVRDSWPLSEHESLLNRVSWHGCGSDIQTGGLKSVDFERHALTRGYQV